jgi:hypothetical protein
VAVEDTGDLIAFALDSDGTTSHKIATIDSGFEHLADVTFDPERQRLWAVTDDTHDGRTSLLRIDGTGTFVVDSAYDRPVGMPNINNEGLAIAPQSRCVAGKKEVLWSDDGDTDGHSLRRGTINCTVLPAPPVVVAPSIAAALSSARPASGWWTGPVTVTFACTEGSAPIVGGCPAPVTFGADGADQSVTRTITATDGGQATATVGDVDIDSTGPKVEVKGVRDGASYRQGKVPDPRCQASDGLSGLASCTLARKVTKTKYGKRVIVTATAVDVAGNEATNRVVYRVKKRK